MIRFGTGDLSALVVEPCDCGRTTPRLPKIMGRSGDAVRVRAMFVHPRQTDEVMSKYKEVANYQLVVDRPADRDEMLMKLEFTSVPDDMKKWGETLSKDFQGTCKVKFDKIEVVSAGTIAKDVRRIVDRRKY